jgi:Transposase DDE domain
MSMPNSTTTEPPVHTSVGQSPLIKPPTPINLRMLDLYTDYLISSSALTTATGMSSVLEGAISHDEITRFLASRIYTNKDLWKLVKPTIREIETEDGVIVFDDTVEEKQYTDKNDIISYHYDHVFNRYVRGVNILNGIYHNSAGTVPIGYAVVSKDTEYIDKKTGKIKMKSSITKNEQMRDILSAAIHNQVKFRYCLADSWFDSKETMEFIISKGKHFIFALKSNRLVALSPELKRRGKFTAVSELAWGDKTIITGYLKGLDSPVNLIKQIFTNEDDSQGILYLVTSDLTLDYEALTAIYHKRWSVEEYHKSTKSNLGLAKSPTKTIVTQSNHFFCVAVAYHKLERLARSNNLNQFALKAKIYIKAVQAGMQELQQLKLAAGAAT